MVFSLQVAIMNLLASPVPLGPTAQGTVTPTQQINVIQDGTATSDRTRHNHQMLHLEADVKQVGIWFPKGPF